MAKRTAAGVLCFLLAVLAAAGGEGCFRVCCARLLDAATLSAQASDAAALDAAAQAAEAWERCKKPMGILLKHSDADALGGLFRLLAEDAAHGDVPAVKTRLEAVRAQVAVLLEGERFSWENVLHFNVKINIKPLYF